jgi:exopolysaccharide biosynthesis polyprenyl glycosylphosphotransferase
MFQRQRQRIVRIQEVIDAGLFALGFWLAHEIRQWEEFDHFWERPDIGPFREYAWLLLVVLPVVPWALHLQGFYRRPVVSTWRHNYWPLVWGAAWATLALVLAAFLARAQPARGVILLFGPISVGLVMLKEELLRRWLLSRAGRDQRRRRLVLVGSRLDLGRTRQRLLAQAGASLEIVAELEISDLDLDRLAGLLHEHSVNAVMLAASHTHFGQVEQLIATCELEGVEVWLLADFFKTRISRAAADDFHGLPMLVFRSTRDGSWEALGKQVLDLVGALGLLLLFSPVMGLAAALIKLTSPGPVLFRQQRCGLNGRPFIMLKFRSMVTDAEQRQHELARLNEMSGPVFKLTDDPRITPDGRLLRRFSVDEFPQLVNVLRGEMSLVGPRPLPVDQVQRFDDPAHRRRLSVRPGITCLWQVSGRSDVRDFREWVRLDLEYIDHWSLALDLKILLRTVPVVLLGTGAR